MQKIGSMHSTASTLASTLAAGMTNSRPHRNQAVHLVDRLHTGMT